MQPSFESRYSCSYPVEDSVHKLFVDYRRKEGLIEKDHLIDPAWSVSKAKAESVLQWASHIDQ